MGERELMPRGIRVGGRGVLMSRIIKVVKN